MMVPMSTPGAATMFDQGGRERVVAALAVERNIVGLGRVGDHGAQRALGSMRGPGRPRRSARRAKGRARQRIVAAGVEEDEIDAFLRLHLGEHGVRPPRGRGRLATPAWRRSAPDGYVPAVPSGGPQSDITSASRSRHGEQGSRALGQEAAASVSEVPHGRWRASQLPRGLFQQMDEGPVYVTSGSRQADLAGTAAAKVTITRLLVDFRGLAPSGGCR